MAQGVVKWSAYSPSIPIIFAVFESRWGLNFIFKILFEMNEDKQKETGVGPFK